MVTLSVTFFKAIVGAEDLFDQLADDGLEDVTMEPLNTSDLVSYYFSRFKTIKTKSIILDQH